MMSFKRDNWLSVVRIMTITVFIALFSCEGSVPEPTIEELITGKAWIPTSIERESIDVTSDFAGFSLTFSDGTYTSQNGQHVWPGTGTWSILSEDDSQLLRDNNIILDVIAEPNSLILTFEIDENEFSLGGRAEAVSSKYKFTLKR